MTTEEYNRIKGLVHQLAWKFQKRFGGNFDEWLSEANSAILEAFPKWSPERGKLTTFTYYVVYNALTSYGTRETRDRDRERRTADLEATPQRQTDVEILLSDLSEDAKTVCRLLFDGWEQKMQRWSRKRILQWIRTNLWNGGDWSMIRVSLAFAELKGVVR